MKKCNKCGIEKEEGEFYWAVKDVYRRKDCKKCCNAYSKEYAQTEKGRAAILKANAKHAKTDKCKVTKAAYARSDKRKASNAKHQKTDKRKASAAKHAKTDKRKASSAKHAKTDKRKASNAKYAKSEKGKANSARKNAKRRSKTNSVINDLTEKQWVCILKSQGYKCNGCHIFFTEGKKATKDHITPVKEGGGLTKENIQALCKSCNSIKGYRSMEYLLKRLEKRSFSPELWELAACTTGLSQHWCVLNTFGHQRHLPHKSLL